MADTVKSRKRMRKSVYVDDSDDDFSDPTPAQPKPSKLKKKAKDVVVYTSTQATQDVFVDTKSVGRSSRVSAEELRFQRELEDALRMSADETVSSAEIITVGQKEHGPSSADTIDINDLTLTDDEQNKENVGNTDNKNPIISAALSEKEMASTVDNIAMDSPTALATNKILVGLDEKARTPVKRFEAKSGKPKKDLWILSDKAEVGVVNKKAVDTSTDDDENIGKQISVVAQVHTTDEGIQTKKVPQNKGGMDSIVEADDEQDSPPKKRQRRPSKKVMTIDSDSDEDCGDKDDLDFGADDIKEVSEEEENESEDEYKPETKKKAKTPAKKTKPSPKTKKKSPATRKSTEKKVVESTKAPELDKEDTGASDAEVEKEVAKVDIKKDVEKEDIKDCDGSDDDDDDFYTVKSRTTTRSRDSNHSKAATAAVKKLDAKSIVSPKTTSTTATKPISSPKTTTATKAVVNTPKSVSNPTKAVSTTPKVGISVSRTPAMISPKPGIGGDRESITSVVTPGLFRGKPSLGSAFTKVKIPSWTPPTKVSAGGRGAVGQTSSPALGISPAAGRMRLGLSRNFRSLKPLHSSVKNN